MPDVHPNTAHFTYNPVAGGVKRGPALTSEHVDTETDLRALSEPERRTRELDILNAVAEALNSGPDIRQALQQTLSLVADLLGLQTGWAWLLDSDTGRFYNAAALNLPPYLQRPIRMRGRRCWCIRAFEGGELTPKNIDVLECSRLRPAVRARAVELTQGLQYHASIPLYFRDRPLGIMNLTSPTWRRLTADELRLLSTIGYQVGIAIERARLAEESTRLARAEERTRIAREIHDTLAQRLTAIGLQLEGALNHIDSRPDLARRRLERALAISRESLEEARQSVLDLRATPLGKPLPAALSALARTFTSESGIRVPLRRIGETALSARAEAELFRIAQEALTNVRRHAHATDALIVLQTIAGEVRLSIQDNGRGFDSDATLEGHHGILGMRERAALLGGQLHVETQPGRGTTIIAVVPAANEDA